MGERSGGILPYSGWRLTNGLTKDPLKIDFSGRACGLVNTYAREMNGQTNHRNNLLHCKGDVCNLSLGDGSVRTYERVGSLPSSLLGEELNPIMAAQVVDPQYFLLKKEVLPSGNQIFFTYDDAYHLISIEMKNPNEKSLSWIHISYELDGKKAEVNITTSDKRKVSYQFVGKQLVNVSGSHSMPVSYEYNGTLLTKKIMPEGRFVEVTYQDGKVKTLKGPHGHSGHSEVVQTFLYGKNFTEVFNAIGTKTRYLYDNSSFLTSIERYDHLGSLYRVEHKFWGRAKSNDGFLLAKAIGDGHGRIYSYRSFTYDNSGNIIEEKLYGNLTGKRDVFLSLGHDGTLLNPNEADCHTKTFGYSTDGFNLLTRIGDCKGNQTLYSYKPGTNLQLGKLIYDKGIIKKRTFYSYNEDGACIKVIEDDGSSEKESKIFGWSVSERHIKEIQPKETLPGVGLPVVVEEKALDLKTKKEILIKKMINTFDERSNLVACETYDSNDEYAFTETRTYTSTGKIASQTDALGREVLFTYDEVGNEIYRLMPFENKSISTTYDFRNLPVRVVESNADETVTIENTYDVLGRKIATRDRSGQVTNYEYDSLHRLVKVIHPEVLDEMGKSFIQHFTTHMISLVTLSN